MVLNLVMIVLYSSMYLNNLMSIDNRADYYGKPVFKIGLKWREKSVQSFERAIVQYKSAMIVLRNKKLEKFPEIHNVRNSYLRNSINKKREKIMNEFDGKIIRYTYKLRKMEKDGYKIPTKYLEHLDRLAYLKANFDLIYGNLKHLCYEMKLINVSTEDGLNRRIVSGLIMRYIKCIDVSGYLTGNYLRLRNAIEKGEKR